MADAAAAEGRPDAAQRVAGDLLELARSRPRRGLRSFAALWGRAARPGEGLGGEEAR
jgi:hypothetical protein